LLIKSPDDRILAIYGYGHLGWLRQDVANDPTVRRRALADLTASLPIPRLSTTPRGG
jgi:hypothetical protein